MFAPKRAPREHFQELADHTGQRLGKTRQWEEIFPPRISSQSLILLDTGPENLKHVKLVNNLGTLHSIIEPDGKKTRKGRLFLPSTTRSSTPLFIQVVVLSASSSFFHAKSPYSLIRCKHSLGLLFIPIYIISNAV